MAVITAHCQRVGVFESPPAGSKAGILDYGQLCICGVQLP